jgi:hypothetical protein
VTGVLLLAAFGVKAAKIESVEEPVFLVIRECESVRAFVYYDDESYVTVPASAVNSERALQNVRKLKALAEKNGRTGVIDVPNKERCPEV